MSFVSYPPLFVHQFSHAFVDFRNIRDDYADYFLNSVLATKAQRQMAIKLRDRFPHYGPHLWGLTSSDSAAGYVDWGGPHPCDRVDGTVVPCAAAGSIPFLPDEAIATVRFMHDAYAQHGVWRRYGLVDAFNPQTGWVATDAIGIDVGITLLMIENHRSGFVWNKLMPHPALQRALTAAGFRRYEPEQDDAGRLLAMTSVFPSDTNLHKLAARKALDVPRTASDGLTDVGELSWQQLDLGDALEIGRAVAGHLVAARFFFAWSDDALHLRVDVDDNRLALDPNAAKHDAVEVYLDPQNDGLLWGDPADLQFAFRPSLEPAATTVLDTFGQRTNVTGRVEPTESGYRVTTAIPFEALSIKPQPGASLGASVAVRSVDPQSQTPLKLNWSWLPHVQRVYLGELRLSDQPLAVGSPAPAAEADPATPPAP